MKKLVILLLSLTLFVGCATNSMRTLAATQDAIYGAKKSWVAYLKAEYKRIDNLPAEEQIPLRDALVKKRDRVRELSDEVDAVWWAAWNAAKYNTSAPPSEDLVKAIANLKLAIAP